ncbi:16S rRNA (uracil(1498)-N(3))-methyltransferase [Naasia lichenicola]|uniref:Ribosomal RNA small subunit methyltransferase E n=1 Tax=Naasia lichenicola TaxID=2565933 RepID=A0A4S4FF10_9MICO|nr:16S rRNA (uracil(1498)-N(3))-methyltransferase [Naasia lichenicola]THG28770.1 16S rRNA (uracil(1498)-N(3))-methyltransferase [Naasia lichenicola]
MVHFYLTDVLTDVAVGDTARVFGLEARHASTVARVQIGEVIALGDGKGIVVQGEVLSTTAATLAVAVTDVTVTPPREPSLTLVQALAKGDRDEMAVQAATELGVDRIIPWQADRSISRWSGPKAERGLERWQIISREAVKQSKRPWVPVVSPLADLRDLETLVTEVRTVILEPTATDGLGKFVNMLKAPVRGEGGKFRAKPVPDLAIIVGPEGGVAPRELAALVAAGATPIKLGDEVLRTSTAGPAAIAVLSLLLKRWG